MSFPIKGVDVHELPEDLKRYIQDQTASGLGKLKLMNVAFPVFVMNPWNYKDNFKSTLIRQSLGTGVDTLVLEWSVPADEIWEINNIYAHTSAAAGVCILQEWDGTNAIPIKRVPSAQEIYWSGKIMLDEGRTIRCQMPNGNLLLNAIGVIRYR